VPAKPIEPPEVAKAFVRDMLAFHAEKSPLKRDEIASRQIMSFNIKASTSGRSSCTR
jgi:hypothetical protein